MVGTVSASGSAFGGGAGDTQERAAPSPNPSPCPRRSGVLPAVVRELARRAEGDGLAMRRVGMVVVADVLRDDAAAAPRLRLASSTPGIPARRHIPKMVYKLDLVWSSSH
jgi:hypothetical protein